MNLSWVLMTQHHHDGTVPLAIHIQEIVFTGVPTYSFLKQNVPDKVVRIVLYQLLSNFERHSERSPPSEESLFAF